jgi:hypothetical protein
MRRSSTIRIRDQESSQRSRKKYRPEICSEDFSGRYFFFGFSHTYFK